MVVPRAKKATWSTTTAPLPRSLPDHLAIQRAVLFSVSCSSSSFCVAVGAVDDTDVNAFPLIETYSGGVWSASVAPLPTNAALSANSGPADPLISVSCPADGTCAAVGEYDIAVGVGVHPLLETLSKGKWKATEGDLPSSPSPDNASMNAISCPSAQMCMATGDGNDSGRPGLVYLLSSGKWQLEPSLPLPPDFDSNLDLASVSCADSTDCVVVGSYDTPFTPNSSSLGLIYTYKSGNWTVEQAQMPANASALQDFIPLGLLSVDCVQATLCVAGGSYEDTSGNLVPLFVTLKSGKWTPKEGPSLQSTQRPSASFVTGVSCVTTANCVADGYSFALSGGSQPKGMVLTEVRGRWTAFASNLPSYNRKLWIRDRLKGATYPPS
jgi:hypothetical protein